MNTAIGILFIWLLLLTIISGAMFYSVNEYIVANSKLTHEITLTLKELVEK